MQAYHPTYRQTFIHKQKAHTTYQALEFGSMIIEHSGHKTVISTKKLAQVFFGELMVQKMVEGRRRCKEMEKGRLWGGRVGTE